jgi:GTPase SAR1 family protein
MIEERYFSSGSEPHYKIIMIGDPFVGKTTLFWRYIEG